MKKVCKIIALSFLCLFLLCFGISSLTGPIARKYIEKHAKDLCNRNVSIEKLKVNLLVGRAKIIDFSMLESDDSTNFVCFDTLKVDIKLRRLLAHEIFLSEISLANPVINVKQDGSSFNFDDIIHFFNSSDSVDIATDTASANPWAFDIRKISLRNGQLRYEDLQVGSDFVTKELSLKIPRIYFSGNNTDVGIDLKFAQGGILKAKLLYDFDKAKYDLLLQLNGFALNVIRPYLRNTLNINDIDGGFSAYLSLVGDIEHIMNIEASGSLSVNNFEISDTNDNPIMTFDSIRIDAKDIDLSKNAFVLDNILLSGLNINYVNDKDGNTLSKLIVSDTSQSVPESLPSGLSDDDSQITENVSDESQTVQDRMPLSFSVDDFKIVNSCINYQDVTMITPFDFSIKDINISSDFLSSYQRSVINLNAVVGHGGEITGKWDGFLTDLSNQSLQIALRNIKTSDFSPYCVQYTGYPITNGIMSFSCNGNVVDSYLKSENELELFNCKIGNFIKQDSIYDSVNVKKVPVKAALYILEDLNGKVKINLPVKGDFNNPKFSYRKALFNALGTFLIKTVASPVTLITKSLGKNNHVFDDMVFPYQVENFTNDNYNQLNQIVEILKEKPESVLTITQSLDKNSSIEEKSVEKRVKSLDEMFLDFFSKQGISNSNIKTMPIDTVKFASTGHVIVSFNIEVD